MRVPDVLFFLDFILLLIAFLQIFTAVASAEREREHQVARLIEECLSKLITTNFENELTRDHCLSQWSPV